MSKTWAGVVKTNFKEGEKLTYSNPVRVAKHSVKISEEAYSGFVRISVNDIKSLCREMRCEFHAFECEYKFLQKFMGRFDIDQLISEGEHLGYQVWHGYDDENKMVVQISSDSNGDVHIMYRMNPCDDYLDRFFAMFPSV